MPLLYSDEKPVTPELLTQIAQWFNHPGRRVFYDAIRSQMAIRSAKMINSHCECAEEFRHVNELNSEQIEFLAEIARLQQALNVLDEFEAEAEKRLQENQAPMIIIDKLRVGEPHE